MRIVRFTESNDLALLYGFRHSLFVDTLGWLGPADDGLLTDEFDSVAINFAAIHPERGVVGSVRLVPDSPLGFPAERCGLLDGFRKMGAFGEISRLGVEEDLRVSRLSAELMRAAYQQARREAITHVLLDIYLDGQNEALYRRMGFVDLVRPYEDTYHLLDCPSAIMVADCPSCEQTMREESPALYKFFTAPAID